MALAANKLLLAGGILVGCSTSSIAGEWSAAPVLSWSADHHSNRLLREGTPAGESVGGTLDLLVARRDDTSEIVINPHVRVQRFTDDVSTDWDDMRLAVNTRWEFERANLHVSGMTAEESTLTTELAETGFVRADAARRTTGGALAWSLFHSPSRQTILNLSHSDVSYTGAYDGRLFGYRFAALSVGESFGVSERTAFNITGSATQLESPERGSESHEHAASVGIEFAWTERTSLSASFGFSRREVDRRESNGTTRDLALEHKGETREWSLRYSHSLVPYGTGVLAERDTAAFGLTQHLTSRLRAGLNVGTARNRDVGFGFELDRRTYRYGNVELGWRIKETWTVAAVAGVASASASELYSSGGSVDGWSCALRSVWAPSPRTFGH